MHTMTRPYGNDELDALVREAAEAPVNEARMATRLNAALAERRASWSWPAVPRAPRLALAGFAALLVTTPVVIAKTGQPAASDDFAIALAFGEGVALRVIGVDP
jgi:hypothetical protein